MKLNGLRSLNILNPDRTSLTASVRSMVSTLCRLLQDQGLVVVVVVVGGGINYMYLNSHVYDLYTIAVFKYPKFINPMQL